VRIVFSYFKYKQSSDYTIISHRNPKKKSGFNFGVGGLISEKVLTDQLKSLEQDGLIIRKQFQEIPPRVEYSLTERAKGLNDVFEAIEKWSAITGN